MKAPAKPYDSVSLIAQGCWLEQRKAEPPLQPVPAPKSTGLSSAEHDWTGWEKSALFFQAHEGLQQSQKRVVRASPE